MTTHKPTVEELRALVGNPDVYAVGDADGWRPVYEPLTDRILRAHRRGDMTVGTYIVRPPDQARTLVFDIDNHADDADPDAELSAVLDVLAQLDLSERGVELSGSGGYHVWLVAEDYMPAAVLYQLGRGIREEAGLPRLEVFPKQTEVRKLGNLVKLPGGVHHRTGKANDFLNGAGYMYRPVSVERLAAAATLYPEVGVRRATDAQSIEYPCVHSIQEGVREGGRNTHLFHLAVMLRRWSITDDNVAAIVNRANSLSPDGPLPQEEIDDLLANSLHSGPVCGQLDEGVHCQDQCILTRHQGLFTRAGAVRWAAEGERVVVEVESRTEDGKVFELSHPDIEQSRAIIRDPRRTGNGSGADA